jgi:hypothetical protein
MEVDKNGHLELPRPLAAPQTVFALLQRLQDEEVVRRDQLHHSKSGKLHITSS